MLSLAAMVLEKLLDQATDGALQRLWPKVDNIQHDLDRLLDGQQRQLLAPLKAAFSHLELGRLELARDLLIEAEALEPYAPVVKMLLAGVLALGGMTGPAVTRRLEEAFALNPFLVPKEIRLAGPEDSEPVAQWSLNLNTLGVGRNDLRTWALGPPPGPTPTFRAKPTPSVRITDLAIAASTTTGEQRAVVRWAAFDAPNCWMAVVDVRDGRPCWGSARANYPQPTDSPVLVAPSAIALNAVGGDIVLVATASGEGLRRMSAAAFGLLYWPGWEQRSSDPRYLRSHVNFPRLQVPARSWLERPPYPSRTMWGPVCPALQPSGIPRLAGVNRYGVGLPAVGKGWAAMASLASASLTTVFTGMPAKATDVAGVIQAVDGPSIGLQRRFGEQTGAP